MYVSACGCSKGICVSKYDGLRLWLDTSFCRDNQEDSGDDVTPNTMDVLLFSWFGKNLLQCIES